MFGHLEHKSEDDWVSTCRKKDGESNGEMQRQIDLGGNMYRWSLDILIACSGIWMGIYSGICEGT